MPDGYDPSRQVLINSMFSYWIPAYRTPVLLTLVALVLLLLLRRHRRRRGV